MNPPALSVVMTTFRNPQALRLALVALAEEARAIGAVELLVGDDGDDEHASRGPCERIAEAGAFCSLQRFWQRRDGFRRARMLNHLVSRASAPQVLFLDGDCLVTRGLLSAHLSAFEPWRFLSGAMVRLGKEVSGGLSEDDARTFRHDRLSWALSTLARGGFDSNSHYPLVRAAGLAAAADAVSKNRGFIGGASSAPADLLAHVNGWESTMEGYGYEDVELRDRLERAGARSRNLRMRGAVVHLWHERPYRDEKRYAQNREWVHERRRTSGYRAQVGLAQLKAEPTDRWEVFATPSLKGHGKGMTA